MREIQKLLIKHHSDKLPDFNDKLLLEYRANAISTLKNHISDMLRSSIQMLKGKLTYKGFSVLSPEEHIQYIKTNAILNRRYPLQWNTVEICKFLFEFESVEYPIYIPIPYLKNGAITIDGTNHYPLFSIVEKGGLHVLDNGVVIKLPSIPLAFNRNIKTEIQTVEGAVYVSDMVTCKIHQKTKDKNLVPVILYHMTAFPLAEVLDRFGFRGDDFKLVREVEPSDNAVHIDLGNDTFLRVRTKIFDNIHTRRFVAEYVSIIRQVSKFRFADLPHQRFYTAVLGSYFTPAYKSVEEQYGNAINHLQSMDNVLDNASIYQLSHVDINVSNFYELLHAVHFNIDQWIVGYDPTNLYSKKVGSLAQLMAPLVSNINMKIYAIVNDNRPLTTARVKSFVAGASQLSWRVPQDCFRGNPTIYNDNWFCAIGVKKFRSLDNLENRGFGRGGKKQTVSKRLLTAHPSQLVVESALSLPSSNPVIGGDINPFLLIDDDGNIIRPDWANDIEHVFD